MGVDYRQVFLNSSSPLVVMDAATHRFVDCNPAAAAIYGLGSIRETVGKSPIDVSAPVQYDGTPSLEQASRYIERALNEGSVVFEWRHQRPDGRTWDAEVHLQRFESEGRTLLQFTLVDITERRRVADELAKSRANLSALIESTTDMVWSVDLGFGLLTFNATVANYFRTNFGTQPCAGATPDMLLPPERAAIWPPLYRRVLENGPFKLEHPLSDGRTLEVSFHPIVQHGERAGISAFGKDITERRRAEKAVQEQAARLRSLLDTIPDLVWLKDPSGVYLNCNHRFERLFGAKEQAILGRTDYDFVDHALADSFREHDRKAIAAGRPTMNEEEVVYASDGHREYLETIKTPVYGTGGEILGVLGIGRDITARKLAERELRAAQERTERYLGAIEVILVGLDLEARVTLLNRKGYAILGYAEGELTGKDWFSVCIAPKSRDGVDVVYRRIISEELEQVNRYENYVLRRDGEERLIEWHTTLVRDDSGKVLGTLSSGEDITQQRRIEIAEAAERDFNALLLDSTPAFYVAIDNRGRVRSMNTTMLRRLGYTPDEIVGLDYLAHFVPEEDRAALEEVFARITRSRERTVNENRVLAKNGQVLLCEWHGTPIYREERFDFLIGMGIDVTERKQAEAALERQREFDVLATRFLSRIVSDDGSALDAVIRDGLGELARFFGADLALNALFNADRTAYSVTHDWCVPGLSSPRPQLQNVALGTSPWIEHQILSGKLVVMPRLDAAPPEAEISRRRWAAMGMRSFMQVPFRGHGGAIQGSLSVFALTRDVDYQQQDARRLSLMADAIANALERRRVEQALGDSEAQFRNFFENMLSGVVVLEVLLDDSGKPIDHRVLQTNPVFDEMTGLSRGEQIGRTSAEDSFVWPAEVAQRYYAVAFGAEPLVTERYDEFSKRYYEVRVFSPRRGQFAMVFHDITQRKRAEAQLRQEAKRTAILLELHARSPSLSDRALYDFALDHAVELTESKIGFLHQINADQRTIELTTWNRRAVEACSAVYDTHYPIDAAGNWVDCIRQKRAIIYNEYAESPNRKGLPMGHAPIRRFMSIPVMDGDEVRLIFGVGNKDTSYTEYESSLLQLVANELHKILLQRRAEAELRIARENAERYLRAAEVILVAFDDQARITLLNRKGHSVLGYAEGELTGKNWFDVCLPPEQRESVFAEYQRVVSGELVPFEYYENQVVCKDGQQLLIAWHNTMLRDTAGRVIGTLSSGEDITERKRSEQQLALLKHSIDVHPDAAYWTDESGRFVYLNEASCHALGYRTDELLGKTIDVINPRATPEHWRNVWNRLREHGFDRDESVHRRKDDSEFPVEIMSSYVRFGGNEYNCGFARDISERKRIEDEQRKVQVRLNQAQKMEAIGTLAGGIAHDFNNILAAIMGFTELALAELPEGSPVKELLESVDEGVVRAIGLVRQILAFSRQSKQERKPIPLAPIVREALKLLRASLPVTIKIHERYEGSSCVLADSGQFHQIVMNLCTNAGLAMRERGGVLDVCLHERECDSVLAAKHAAISQGRYVCLTIRDTGCGIPPENLERIFEPFFTTRPVGEGTGLGLSVVHGIVEGWGGAIGVVSEVGSGTTFEVLLPVCGTSSDAEFDLATASCGSERVLYVDDEIALTSIATEGLKRLGYDVVAFTAPRRALEAFRACPWDFDIVITDMTMPEITGDALAAEVRRLRPEIPVILASGFLDQFTVDRALGAGVDELVDKPLRLAALSQLIRKLCDRSRDS